MSLNKLSAAEVEVKVDATLKEVSEDPQWSSLVKAVRLSYSSRQRNDNRPYAKFSIPKGTFDPAFLEMKVTCPHCGNKINLVRTGTIPERVGIPAHGYPSFVCKTLQSMGCSRSRASSVIVNKFEEILRTRVIT